MITMGTVVEAVLSWDRPPDVHVTIRLPADRRAIPMEFRLDRCPWGSAVLDLDRPMSVDKVHERIDDAVDDLRRAAKLLPAAYTPSRR